jgi:hypothetical protein
MAKQYLAWNFAAPTTAAPVPVTTGTAIKTLLQIAPPSSAPTTEIYIIRWGITFDGTAAAAPIKCELIETDVAATVTAHVAAGIVSTARPNDAASTMTLGTAATGFTASAEGTTTASRLLDFQQVAPNGGYVMQFPLEQEPSVRTGKFLRVRVTAAAAVNASCYVEWRE